MNQCFLIGNLVAAPEIKEIHGKEKNFQKSSFTLAAPKENDRNSAEFIDCEVWGKTAEAMGKYCDKGAKIGLVGSLRQDKWQDKAGQWQHRTVVVAQTVEFLSMRKEPKQEQGNAAAPAQRQPSMPPSGFDCEPPSYNM